MTKYGEIPYTLFEVLLFSYDSINDTYGDAYELPNDREFTVEPQAQTDELYDSGMVAEALTVATHATFTLGTGGYPSDTIRIMEGGTIGYDGSGDIRELDARAGGEGLPYFGGIGVAASKGGGLYIAGFGKGILDAPLQYSFNGEENAFVTQEAGGRLLARNGRFHKRRWYRTLDMWISNRPTTGADFKTWLDTVYSGSGS